MAVNLNSQRRSLHAFSTAPWWLTKSRTISSNQQIKGAGSLVVSFRLCRWANLPSTTETRKASRLEIQSENHVPHPSTFFSRAYIQEKYKKRHSAKTQEVRSEVRRYDMINTTMTWLRYDRCSTYCVLPTAAPTRRVYKYHILAMDVLIIMTMIHQDHHTTLLQTPCHFNAFLWTYVTQVSYLGLFTSPSPAELPLFTIS